MKYSSEIVEKSHDLNLSRSLHLAQINMGLELELELFHSLCVSKRPFGMNVLRIVRRNMRNVVKFSFSHADSEFEYRDNALFKLTDSEAHV